MNDEQTMFKARKCDDNERIQALSACIDVDIDTATGLYEDEEYLVLTDAEADEAANKAAFDCLWAFQASFLMDYIKLDKTLMPEYDRGDIEKALSEMQEKLCEGGQALIVALVGDPYTVVGDAVSLDGRGHFLAQYDGDEQSHGDYYIYRIGG